MKELRADITEVRAAGGAGDSDPLRLEGYAAKFNKYSQDLGSFKEKLAPGTFKRAIEEKQDCRCLLNHSADYVLGRVKNGTLTLKEDNTGLWYSCILPNTQSARDIHELVRVGNIDGCSFSFTVPKGGESWTEEEDSNGDFFASRTVSDVDLYDCGPVCFPAYLDTNVSARDSSTVSVPLELRSAIDLKNKEKRDQSFEQIRDAVQDALCEKYGNCGANWDCPSSPRYWVIETYPDAVVVCDWNEDCYFRVAYTNTDGKVTLADTLEPVEQTWVPTTERGHVHLAEYRNKRKEAEEKRKEKLLLRSDTDVLKLGDLAIPPFTELDVAALEKFGTAFETVRSYFDAQVKGIAEEVAKRSAPSVETKTEPVPAVTDPAPKEEHSISPTNVSSLNLDSMDEDFDNDDIFDDGDEPSAYAAGHTDDGDCDDAECNCQNRWSVTGDEMLSLEVGERQLKIGDTVVIKSGGPDMAVLTASSENELHVATEWLAQDGTTQRAVFPVTSLFIREARAQQKVRTKRVSGKDLPASKFAYVGDKDKTETWKLPIHDKDHAQNALARFNQTEGIPADKKAAVHAKIVSAAEKFGIDVKEKDSAPEPEHTEVPPVMSEEDKQFCLSRAKIIAAMLDEEIE